MAERHVAQSVGMEIRGWPSQRESAFGDHSLSVAQSSMARRAIDIESLLAAQDERLELRRGKLHRQRCDQVAVIVSTGEERRVLFQVAACDGAGNEWPCRGFIREE